MFFERPDSGETAVLVHIDFPEGDDREDPREFEELVLSAGGDPVVIVTGARSTPDPKTYVGSGKLEEIRQAVIENEAGLVLFNHALSPSQERNVEAVLECRVLDRTGLILDIFAQRARTHEGKLQVELAQLAHQSTRLIRGWTHLERQKGGIGMRGPGETQLESDRRMLRKRINTLTGRLEKVRAQRDQGRRKRIRSAVPTVSLVGYTNAGKSSLFNTITDAGVYEANQLFATLDPTLRRFPLPDIGEVVLVDTVGFIRHLPHKLVESFRATLQETVEANLLLHVIDSADPERVQNMREVDHVLKEINAHEQPLLEIFNKADLLEDHGEPRLERNDKGLPSRVWLSAKTGAGIDLLRDAIAELLGEDVLQREIIVPVAHGQLRALLYKQGAVMEETILEDGSMQLNIRIQEVDFKQILAKANVPVETYIDPVIEDYLL